ncbi:hemolysin D [Luteitalea sp. TBR-22]|nr:hemolysin D [Luteitalea sp. TBR-22]
MLLTACATNEAAPAPPPPPTVPVVQVAPETVQVSSEWITTLDGQVNAQIRPQVSGYLVRRAYQEGGRVRKGDVLFEIDRRPFAVALAQAEARLAETRAQLARAAQDVARNTPLARERAIAQSQLDNDIQAQRVAEAAVSAAQASVEGARLNLEFTRVRSLVDGIAAIATAQIGDLVGPQTLLTTVSQVDPIRAYFSLSEREYLELAEAINTNGPARRLWAAGPGLTLVLADGSAYPLPGRFQAADRQFDPRTGTMRVSAVFPNPRGVLRPGQYGRVTVTTRRLDGALLVPQRAVSESQGGTQVRTVTREGTVQLRPVTTGPRVGARWVVERGLQAGDRVIVDAGQLAEGTRVNTTPFVDVASTGAAASTSVAPPEAPSASPAAGTGGH